MYNHTRNYTWVLLLLVIAFVAGIYVNARTQPPVPQTQRSLLEVINEAFTTHVICWGPVALLTAMGIVVGGIRGFFYIQERHTQLQLQKAAVEQERMHIETTRTLITAPHVLTDATGRQVLVNPALTTRAVTHIDADSEVDSEQLRAARMLAGALQHAGSANWGQRHMSPEMLAMMLGSRMIPLEERVPNEVHILSADETKALEAN